MSPVVRVMAMVGVGMLRGPLPVVMVPTELLAGETAPTAGQDSTPTRDLTLTVHEDRLSLKAHNASLRTVVEEMGRRLSSEVIACIPADERVTLAFDQLSLAEALKCFRPYINYAMVEDTAMGPGAMRTLLVVSKRLSGGPSSLTASEAHEVTPPVTPRRVLSTETSPARLKPFRFEFDPSAGREPAR